MIPARAIPFPWRLPAPLLNGASVGVGLAVIMALVASVGGMPAAVAASSGAAAVSVADTVATPRAKPSQMVPALIGSVLVAALVALTHAQLWALTACVLIVSFTGVMWNAWGKRGGPQTFAMILSLVFQMAAFAGHPMDAHATWQHLGWVTVGGLGLALWSLGTAMLLAGRYRTLALVDSLRALAQLMRTQAAWTASAGRPAPDAPPASLLPMVRQQAAIADVFQSARDLLYSQAAKAPPGSRTLRLTSALFHIVNLRDVVLACQLDIDRLPANAHAQHTLQALAQTLTHQADHLDDLALALRNNTRLPEAAPRPTHTWPEHDARLISLGRRAQHMVQLGQDIASSLGKRSQPLPMDAAVLLTLVSPTEWTLVPLRAQLNWQSPVLRHALRATLAMGCADALAHWLPWTSHPHWLLMTVAVVMRGNLEQTLARRDARIVGTLAGCVLASCLLWLDPGAGWLLAVLALSLSLAHGYVLRNYRVTAASGALLALLQAHLFAPSHHPALYVAGERLADTLIGAGLAWGFSYVLPSWERSRLPDLVRRLLNAQAHYAHHVLRWHQSHPQSAKRSHARREVYDTLWLLAQVLDRVKKEPRRERAQHAKLETVLIRSHRLISHLAGIKGLLTLRQSELDPALVQPALEASEQALKTLLTQGASTVDAIPPAAPGPDLVIDLPAAHAEPGPWLLHRLDQAVDEARALAQAAQALTATPSG